MFVLLTVAILSYAIIRSRHRIRETIGYFRLFRRSIDPDGKKGLCHCLFSFTMVAAMTKLVAMKSTSIASPTVEPFNRKFLKISYTYKDRSYFYLLKIPKGVAPLTKIEDENGNDIYEAMTPYFGPNLDCHRLELRPSDFGYQKIVVTTAFDDIITFNEADVIAF